MSRGKPHIFNQLFQGKVMDTSVKRVIRAKQIIKTKLKVLGFVKGSVVKSTWVTEEIDVPDYIEGVYNNTPDDIIEDVPSDHQYDDFEEK